MSWKSKNNKSIANLVSRRTTGILIIMLLVLLAMANLILTRLVHKNTEKESEQLVTMFADNIKNQYEAAGIPISPDYPEIAIKNADYMCECFDIDYAFVIVPRPEKDEHTFVCLSCKDPEKAKEHPNHSVGVVSHSVYSQGEIDFYNGKKEYSHIVQNKEAYGNEMITEKIVTDPFGTKVSVGVDVDHKAIHVDIINYFAVMGGLLVLVIIAVRMGLYYVIEKQVSVPAQNLSMTMRNFVAGGRKTEIPIGELKSDEYRMIAASFDVMSRNIEEYLEDIKQLTREGERQQAELDIASEIQQGFLPDGRFSNDRYEISAVMKTAKEVGGDLYDYAVLDDKRVLIVIADVSGKGLAASLFMGVTLVLIRQFAKMEPDPAVILKRTNDALINPNLLFVTAFVGIYDSETGILTYSNAGHNPPYIVGDDVRKLDGADGVVLGLYEGENYTGKTAALAPNDTLLLYTDGVTEAVNNEKEMFGEARLEEKLASYRASGKTNIVEYVSDAVEAFTAGCEAHDDITMIALKRK